ncbi:MAG: TIGR03960 family B12-binding radical SAM protein [Clostridia bacterium]
MKKEIEEILLKVQKPTRYCGGEFGSVIKDLKNIDLRFAFCFPDTYEVGMSHLGMRILYELTNREENMWCERCFAPLPDMEKLLRENNIPLFTLESEDGLGEFDMVGFTLQYELSYTNILNMLNLANIPLKSCDRDEQYPLIIAGGPCALNPEPLADFIDLFIFGEGEEINIELYKLYIACKGMPRLEFLKKASKLKGIYVPSFYEIKYNDDGTINKRISLYDAPETIKKVVVEDLDSMFYPSKTIVPFGEIVHDRVMIELFRGCIRGCRFCQAGFIYRPVREKSPDTLNAQAKSLCETTGYDELSLSSLSSSDYTGMSELLDKLTQWSVPQKVNLSLPSLRVDKFSKELMTKIQSLKKSNFTFAPEAGTQRLRDVINKNVTEEELINTCKVAFEGGNSSIKLYFMMGLPYETIEDIKGINTLCENVVHIYNITKTAKNRAVTVSISTACFVPKPFTPFQWFPQNKYSELIKKQEILKEEITSRKIKFNYHDSKTCVLEAVFARGDRRLCKVLETAYKSGCIFDGWSEHFNFSKWEQAFLDCGVSIDFYANRERSYDEVLPWDFVDIGISKKFLISENEKAKQAIVTPNCREKCSGCGLSEGDNKCKL